MRKCPKLVVAHFMVGNTYPYKLEDWEEDISFAQRHDFDGFALNVGKEEWQLDRVTDCFEAAKRRQGGFKLFISFDMSSIPSSTRSDIGYLKTYFSRFADHPNYLLYGESGGKALVSTFAGEHALFGHETLSDAWLAVRKQLENIHPIFFLPSFFIEPIALRSMTCIDGAFNWNSGWPVHLDSSSPPDEVHYPKLDYDKPYLDALKPMGKAYMAAISPWFFTHYGVDSWNKNVSDLYRHIQVRDIPHIFHFTPCFGPWSAEWEQLTSPPLCDEIDIVQLISWNDFGESHYVGPVFPNAAQPGSQAWVDGFPHTPWLRICAPFARAFKRSAEQSRLGSSLSIANEMNREDRIIAWARPHPRDAVARNDSVGRPTNWQLTEDFFWVAVFARVPAQIALSSYSPLIPGLGTHGEVDHINDIRSDSVWTWHNVPAGLSKLKYPLIVGGSMYARLVRDGRIIVELDASCPRGVEAGFIFEEKPETYNFNAYVAMAPDAEEH